MEMKDILEKFKKGSIFLITIDGNSRTEEEIYRTSDGYSIKCPARGRSGNRIGFSQLLLR